MPRKILQENPRKNPPKFIQQKSSDTFLQNGRGNKYAARILDAQIATLIFLSLSCDPPGLAEEAKPSLAQNVKIGDRDTLRAQRLKKFNLA